MLISTPIPMLMSTPTPILFEIFIFIIVPMFKFKWSSKAYISNIVIIKSQFN